MQDCTSEICALSIISRSLKKNVINTINMVYTLTIVNVCIDNFKKYKTKANPNSLILSKSSRQINGKIYCHFLLIFRLFLLLYTLVITRV